MADEWEWRRVNRGGSKSLNFASVLPSGGEYGGSFPSDNETPQLVRQFEAKLAPQSVADDLEAVYLTPLGQFTILDWTGYVTAYSSEDIEGTDRCNVTCTLAKPFLDLTE